MKKLFAPLLLLLLPACAQVTLTVPYSPQTTEEVGGSVKVNDFGYFPPEGVKQNEIKETALGYIYLTEPVGQFIAKAVKREFQQAKISGKGPCTMDGEVNEFSLDSLGYSTDYKTSIRYILYSSGKKVLYDNTHTVGFNASKFVQPEMVMANINKVIADNINKLLTDPEFRKNMGASCN